MPRLAWFAVDFRSLQSRVLRRARRYRAIGFDVFDTLLRRRVEPEYIKDIVARELAGWLARDGNPVDWRLVRHKRRSLEIELGRESEARGDDHEFRLRELMPRWLAEYQGGEPDKRHAAQLVAYELDLERRATCPTPRIAETLAAVAARMPRLIFVSDTYLAAEDVWGLLRHHGLAGYFAAGHCSSTYFRTKHTGRLFTEVLRAEGLTPQQLLFVGDNPSSDAAAPRRLGIGTLLVRDAAEVKRRTRLQILGELSTKNRFWVGALACETVTGLPRHIRYSRSPEYNLGLLLAPAFIAFTRHVIEQVQALKLERLFFLSREGATFLRLYRRLGRALGRADELPPAAYLAVSRAATFLPSLARLDLAELHRLLRQYQQQSLHGLLRNLSLPPAEFRPLAAACGLTDFDAPIADPGAHAPLLAFLADPEVQRRFCAHRDRARALFLAYLRRKGFFDARTVGLVDVGWKGSIQDNLFRAVRHQPDCPELHGLYFGLLHCPEDDLPGSHKYGYMADSRRGDHLESAIFHNGSVFEMFASAIHGGVVGYRALGADRSRDWQGAIPYEQHVKPVIKTEDVERRNFHHYAARVFDGLEAYVQEYLDLAPLLPATADDWKPYVLDQLRRYILYPTIAEARQFLRYSHVESFGVFHVSTYEFKGSRRKILFGGPPTELPHRLLDTLERQFWPESHVRRTHIPLANFLHDLLETRRARLQLAP